MALPLVVFADVELLLTGWLRTALAARTEPFKAGVVVANAVPTNRPARLVTIRRDGGPRLDVARESARVGVNVYAATEQDVSNLAGLVRALLWACPDGAPICRAVELSGPSPIPDVVPRRYQTFEFIVRGADLA